MATPSASYKFKSPGSSKVPGHFAGTPQSPQFSANTTPQEKQIKDTMFYLRRPLIRRDQDAAYVYVTKQADSTFCKIGWAVADPVARIGQVERKCDVVTESAWHVGPFFGAYRAERILHCIFKHVNRRKKNCPCGCTNREWYQEDYKLVILQAQIVCGWLCRDPCPYNRVAVVKRLEPDWELALTKWHRTQDREVPLSWNDFFLFGLSADLVSGSAPSTDASPLSLLMSPEYVKTFARSFWKEVRKTKRRVRKPGVGKHVRKHSLVESEASDTEARRTTHQSSPLQAKSTETIGRHFENSDTMAMDPEPDTTTDEEETSWDSPIRVRHSHNVPAPTYVSQQMVAVSGPQDYDDHTTGREKSCADKTWFHHQATIDKCESNSESDRSMDAEFAHLGRPSDSSDDGDIVEISERLARMPGVFPTDYSESAAFEDRQICLYQKPGLLYIHLGFGFIKNVDGSLRCERLNWQALREKKPYILNERTFLADENNLVVCVQAKPPISDELFSEFTSSTEAELQHFPSTSALIGNENMPVKPAGPTSSYVDADDDFKVSPSTSSAPPVSNSLKNSRSDYPAVALCQGTTWLPVVPIKGTETVQSESLIKDQSITAALCRMNYSSEELRLVDYSRDYCSARQEEPDVAEEDSDWDTLSSITDEDRLQTEEEDLDFIKKDSDSDNSSLMNDYDRPQTKRRTFKKKFRDLSRESNRHDYGPQWPRLGFNTLLKGRNRLHGNFQAVKSLLSKKTLHSTRDTGLEEPCEDFLEDRTLSDTHRRETVIKNEEKQRERNLDFQSSGRLVEPQEEQRPGSEACSEFINPAVNPSAAYPNPIKRSEIPKFQFGSFGFGVTQASQKFTFTVPPLNSQSSFSSGTRLADVAPNFNHKAPLDSSPVSTEDSKNSGARRDTPASVDDHSGRANISEEFVGRKKPKEHSNTTPKQPLNLGASEQHDERGRNQMDDDVNIAAANPPQAKLDVRSLQQAIDNTLDEVHASHLTCTDVCKTTLNSAIKLDHKQSSKSQVNDKLARNSIGQIALAIKATAHGWEDNEDSGGDADVSEHKRRHIPTPAIAWGADGRLGLGKKEGLFREKSFLDQQWNFDGG